VDEKKLKLCRYGLSFVGYPSSPLSALVAIMISKCKNSEICTGKELILCQFLINPQCLVKRMKYGTGAGEVILDVVL
jgi:hypothetical protein